jgi:GT2 family glycosyltransferase
VSGDLLFFLDDDACLPEDDILARMAAQFAADPTLGMIQPRVVDPMGRAAPRAGLRGYALATRHVVARR